MKLSTRRRGAPAAAVLSLTLALAACGGDTGNTGATTGSGTSAAAGGDLSGTLSGAGSSAQAAAVQAWQAGFAQLHPDVTVNYDPSGSGAGRDQFLAGATSFAGSDAYLDEEESAQAQERCAGDGGAINLPMYISPIAVAFNVEGVDSLNLTPEVLAGIFNQDITNWNDPAIAEHNPDVTLPDLAITPVNRSDESGTTENFTEYLAAAGGDAWPHEPDGNWPVPGGEAAQGTSGVVGAIEAGNGTIGYADASQIGELPAAAIQVGDAFVPYSPEAAAAVVEASSKVEGRGDHDLAYDLERDTDASGVYPIVLVSYEIACLQYEDAAEAELVKAWFTHMASTEGQQAAAENAGSAPIGDGLREQIMASIEQISAAS